MPPRALGFLIPLFLLAPTFALSPRALAADLTLQVLGAPDVVVAADFDGDEFTTPRYLFSVAAAVTNGDEPRGVQLHVVTYLDRSVRGCPELATGVRPVHLFAKALELGRRERLTVGGLSEQQPGRDVEYWPMEVYRRYPEPGTGTVSNPEGEHGFCVLALASGNDPACSKPATQVCTLASAPLRAHVRHENEAPVIETLEILPPTPRPGQQVLFRATATDADTVPHPDELTYEWQLGPEDATGSVVRERFSTPGTYPVVLRVSDGFVRVTRATNVTVEGLPIGPGDENGSPAPPVAILLLAIAIAVRKREPRSSQRLRRLAETVRDP